jgi:hypothetical protein
MQLCGDRLEQVLPRIRDLTVAPQAIGAQLFDSNISEKQRIVERSDTRRERRTTLGEYTRLSSNEIKEIVSFKLAQGVRMRKPMKSGVLATSSRVNRMPVLMRRKVTPKKERAISNRDFR